MFLSRHKKVKIKLSTTFLPMRHDKPELDRKITLKYHDKNNVAKISIPSLAKTQLHGPQ